MSATGRAIIGVDVGGTFTDVVAIRDGSVQTVKVPTDAVSTELSVLHGAREVGVADAAIFNHASTHGLNAIITRRLPKVAFLTTEGHRDILDIGRCWRPLEGLTNAGWRRPFGDAARPLVPRYLRRGVRERLTATGGTLIGLDEVHARAQLAVLRRCQVQGVAICLLNAYVSGRHEQRLRELAKEELGAGIEVSISSEVSPLAKEFARASTTVIDVFMKLIYADYSERLISGLEPLGFEGELNFADCAARLVPLDVAMEPPFQVVFAGPAAGTRASAHFGALTGDDSLLCCDVGGTSTDISVVTRGDPYVSTTLELEHDLVVNALSNEVSSIGAGGGSIVSVNEFGELKVGPASAGADPGPACYGAGGTQPTVTDACLLIGIIDPDGFAGGRMLLDVDAAVKAFDRLETSLPFGARIRQAFQVGLHNIAEGITNVAIKHGLDPRDYTLMAYGAAGPMLLPAVLDLIGARDVLVPPYPGLFSALGLVSSDLVYGDSRSAYTVLTPDVADDIAAVYSEMETALRARLADDQLAVAEFVRSFDGRLLGQTWETPFIDVPSGPIDGAAVTGMLRNFHLTYGARSGNTFEDLPVQGVTYRVQVRLPADKVQYPRVAERAQGSPVSLGTRPLRYLFDDEIEAQQYGRGSLGCGDRIEGLAIIREGLSTTLILPGQVATVGAFGELRVTRKADRG